MQLDPALVTQLSMPTVAPKINLPRKDDDDYDDHHRHHDKLRNSDLLAHLFCWSCLVLLLVVAVLLLSLVGCCEGRSSIKVSGRLAGNSRDQMTNKRAND